MGAGNIRNMKCPCGSGRKAKKCCLKSGLWCKEPVNVIPPLPATAYKNPKCYLSPFGDCSQKTSREHYISKGILREIYYDGDPEFRVEGFDWIKPGTEGSYTPEAFQAKVLCKRHNESLGKLDEEGLRFFQTIRAITTRFDSAPDFTLFNGCDLERWMLKVAFGFLRSGRCQLKQGVLVKIDHINERHLARLIYPSYWNRKRLEGLYIRQVAYRSESTVGFQPMFLNTQTFAGALINIWGMEFVLGYCDAIQNHPNFKELVYRPVQITFNKQGNKKEIGLFWSDLPETVTRVELKWNRPKKHMTPAEKMPPQKPQNSSYVGFRSA